MSSASETPRSLSHMIGKRGAYFAFSHRRATRDPVRTQVIQVPIGYTLVPVKAKDPSCRGKLCPVFVETGACADMNDTCDYSHSLEEVRSYNQNYRTKICEFAANGCCKKGNACRFAHSSEELGTTINECSKKPALSPIRTERNSSSVSTEPSTPLHSTGGSMHNSFEIHTHTTAAVSSPSISARKSARRATMTVSGVPEGSYVCYQAPPEQRKLKKETSSRHSSVSAVGRNRVYVPQQTLHYFGEDPAHVQWQNATFIPISGGGYHPSGLYYSMPQPVLYGGRIHHHFGADESGSCTPLYEYED